MLLLARYIIFCKTEWSSWSLPSSTTHDNCDKPVSASVLVTNVSYQFRGREALQRGEIPSQSQIRSESARVMETSNVRFQNL